VRQLGMYLTSYCFCKRSFSTFNTVLF